MFCFLCLGDLKPTAETAAVNPCSSAESTPRVQTFRGMPVQSIKSQSVRGQDFELWSITTCVIISLSLTWFPLLSNHSWYRFLVSIFVMVQVVCFFILYIFSLLWADILSHCPVLPDFAQVYAFIGSVFDPNVTGHLQNLKQMDPIDVETVCVLSNTCLFNFASSFKCCCIGDNYV